MDPREKTACFTGHRPEKLFPSDTETAAQVLEIRRSLHARILQAVDDGYTTFLCGMAQGVDLWAGDMVLSLQESVAVLICPDYRPDCYYQRNRYMVDHASRLIGVWREGCPGGTQYTIQYAEKKGLELDLILLP